MEDEKRYIDMTPAIFVFAAVAMAVRYISLGLDTRTSTSSPASPSPSCTVSGPSSQRCRGRKTTDEPGDPLKVATHLVFAECCWFATSAIFDVHYEVPAVLAVAATSILPDADYPKSWLGHQLGSISEDLNRLFGHRSFLHSLLALVLVTVVFGLRRYAGVRQHSEARPQNSPAPT